MTRGYLFPAEVSAAVIEGDGERVPNGLTGRAQGSVRANSVTFHASKKGLSQNVRETLRNWGGGVVTRNSNQISASSLAFKQENPLVG
mmetsp:Transcript_79940/g.141156  ORF Transcript_79940/g.141156 Transcript_79940/m.141156 type:complete len:88 (-) Transcript_79940:1827-2090(-)